MLGSIATMMKCNKSLMAHPNQLIYYMCIAEAFSTYHTIIAMIGAEQVACYFGMSRFLNATTFGAVEEYGGLGFLGKSNLWLMQASQFFSLSLNFCLCVETVKSLKDPFFPAARRMKFYLFFSSIFAVISPFITLSRGINYSTNISY
jgi:hypothetical protein